tara:strand:- start:73 stop:525 length:453 start_codon:yes stop_codon:yes gene_type:complete
MFHTTKFLYFFFFIGGVIGLVNNIIDKNLTQKISPYTILTVDSVIYIVVLLIAMGILGKYPLIKKEVLGLDNTYIAYLLFGGVVSVISSILFLFILKHHDLSKTRVINYAFDIVLLMLAALIVFKEKITIRKIMGLVLVLAGFALFEYKN